jgi:L-seryl-tRNA(Ser) seleniumtransferase
MLSTPQAEIRARAEAIAARLREVLGDAADITTADDVARAGGGALPLADIPSAVVAIAPRTMSAGKLEALLRCGGEPAIVARVKDDRVLLDPRTILSPAEEDAIVARLGEVVGE